MPFGQATAYDLVVGVKVNMDEAIYMLSPQDTPLLTGVGSDGLTVIGSQPVDEIQFSWMHDRILTPRSVTTATATTGQTTLAITSGDQLRFSTGDTIAFGGSAGNEVARITAISATTSGELTITRAWGGTAGTVATGELVIGAGTALAEGSNPENARTVDRVEATNVTQIFGPTKVDMSRTEQQVAKYGVTSEWARQLMGRLKENAIGREQAFLYGARVNSTAGKIRTTGGLRFYITTNVSTATTITHATLLPVQQAGYNAGGFADCLFANPVALDTLNQDTTNQTIWTTVDAPKRGRTRVAYVDTEFGSVQVARNRWCAARDAFGINTEQVVRRVMQPVVFERLAKTGDSDQAQIVGEEGLEVKGQEHMFRFGSLTATGSN